jgi:acyl carrier protein
LETALSLVKPGGGLVAGLGRQRRRRVPTVPEINKMVPGSSSPGIDLTYARPLWKPNAVGTRRTAEKATRMSDRIRQIIQEHGRLPIDVHGLDDDADLYQAGMTSHASVNLMLALEVAFDVEFPDSMLKRSVFQSVASISAALQQLGTTAA